MKNQSIMTKEVEQKSKTGQELFSSLRSIILFFLLLFPLTFMELLLHEGGHALACMIQGETIGLFYVHPFSMDGYVRTLGSSHYALNEAGGHLLALTVSCLILIVFWKRRSVANLPFVTLFPWVALRAGMGMISLAKNTGDFYNLINVTGWPTWPFYVLCSILLVLGILFFVSFFPLLGLTPRSKRTLFVIPAGILLWSMVGIAAANLFIPGSRADVQFHLGDNLISSVKFAPYMGLIFGVFVALVYLTLYRVMERRLPSCLRVEKKNLTWRDLLIPGIICVISIAAGTFFILL